MPLRAPDQLQPRMTQSRRLQTFSRSSRNEAVRPSRDIAGDYGWCRVSKAAEAFRRWHGVYSALPTRLALGPIGGPVRVGKGGPQIGAPIETPGPPLPTLRLLRSFRCRPRRAARAHARIYGGLNLLIPHRARPEFDDADLCKKI